jgi:DNA ligase-4
MQIFNQMNKQDQPNSPLDPTTIQRIESQIQDKVNAGYTAPRGWLFRGLTFCFYTQPNESNADEQTRKEDIRLRLAQNTARFAGAQSAASLKDSGITHVVVDTESSFSVDLPSVRKYLAENLCNKVPHVVSVGWIEECWKNGTLLDEESKFEHPVEVPLGHAI